MGHTAHTGTQPVYSCTTYICKNSKAFLNEQYTVVYTYILPETLKELQLCTHIHVGTYDATGAAVCIDIVPLEVIIYVITYMYANEHSAPPMDSSRVFNSIPRGT